MDHVKLANDMSFIQSTVKCQECGFEMNVAFGIVNMTQIAESPKDCAKCHGPLKKISDGWNAKNGEPTVIKEFPSKAVDEYYKKHGKLPNERYGT